MCACEAGYSGTDCTVDIDDCFAGSCETRATCVVSKIYLSKIDLIISSQVITML